MRGAKEPLQECDSCGQEYPQSQLEHCEDCAEEFCPECYDDPGAHASGCTMVTEGEEIDDEESEEEG